MTKKTAFNILAITAQQEKPTKSKSCAHINEKSKKFTKRQKARNTKKINFKEKLKRTQNIHIE